MREKQTARNKCIDSLNGMNDVCYVEFPDRSVRCDLVGGSVLYTELHVLVDCVL